MWVKAVQYRSVLQCEIVLEHIHSNKRQYGDLMKHPRGYAQKSDNKLTQTTMSPSNTCMHTA